MAKYNQVYDCTIQIGKFKCPSYRWSTDVGTYGQLGRSVVNTSIKALRNAGINLNSLNAQLQPANSNTKASPSTLNIPVSVTVNGDTIFGGYYSHGHYSFGYPKNDAEIWIRDYACVLFDSKTSLADLNYQNSTINELVKLICNAKGLASKVTSTLGAKTQVGSVFAITGIAQGGITLSTYPQSYWNIINLLARYVNAQVYTVPSENNGIGQASAGTLIFEDVPKNPIVHRYTWQQRPVLNGPSLPALMDIDALHQPQKNKNFAVVVKSHHQQSTLTSVQTVTVAGEDIPTTNNKTIPAGFYSGTGGSAAQIRGLLSNKALGLPIYEFRYDGLTATQAQEKAEAIAKDIASKLFCVNVTMDFARTIKPLNQLLIKENTPGELLHFTDKVLYINGVQHTFGMPTGDGLGNEGLQTHLKCLSLPPVLNPLDPDALSVLIGGT